VVAEAGEAAFGFVGGGAGEVLVLVSVDHREQVLASAEGLFALDLGAEPEVRGA
jgi:hypothetical protein